MDEERFFLSLKVIHPKLLFEVFSKKTQPKFKEAWFIRNEIKPIDLYCYLCAKYGRPNGIMNFLRGDTSDNLVHWEWALFDDECLILIQGHNFRTEIQILGTIPSSESKLTFIKQIKNDLKNYAKPMRGVREHLEKWTEFVNPYHNIKSTIEQQIGELRQLNLSPETDRVPSPKSHLELQEFKDKFTAATQRYIFATGLAFGLRCMLPVLAETFLNLLIFALCKKPLRDDQKKYEEFVSDTIRNRLNNLHVNCFGFERAVDESKSECREFYKLMNDRNDLLHGNFKISKLKTGDVYFNGRVPVFYEYKDMWAKTIGTTIDFVKLSTIEKNLKTVNEFVEYLISLLSEDKKKLVRDLMSIRDLGYFEKENRYGILFSGRAVDMFMAFEDETPGS